MKFSTIIYQIQIKLKWIELNQRRYPKILQFSNHVVISVENYG